MIKENTNLPKRSHLAHPPPLHKHNRPVIIFLTVCINPRRSILDNEKAHKALKISWKHAAEWTVGYYLIMPDHIHLFCSPSNDGNTDLKKWISFWKWLVSKKYPAVSGMWQNDYWDTQMRSGEHWLQKAEYVRNNPVRYGLVNSSKEWSYQGIMSELWW